MGPLIGIIASALLNKSNGKEAAAKTELTKPTQVVEPTAQANVDTPEPTIAAPDMSNDLSIGRLAEPGGNSYIGQIPTSKDEARGFVKGKLTDLINNSIYGG